MNKKLLTFLTLVISLLFLVIFSWPDDRLHIVACDVGQGDAFLLMHKQAQVLVDSGPGSKVLDCLTRYMPFWDRTLELVVLTHAQKDHYGRMDAVLERYQVQALVASSLGSSSEEYQVIEKMVGDLGIQVIRPFAGRKVRVGLISLDILWPSHEALASLDVNDDPNNFSVVFELQYKDFEALFTGDIGPETEGKILALGKVRDVELIKVPHHGSRNGLSKAFLQAARPEVAFIGVGKNSWGHPHREVLDMLGEHGAQIYRTDVNSYFELVTDGRIWKVID